MYIPHLEESVLGTAVAIVPVVVARIDKSASGSDDCQLSCPVCVSHTPAVIFQCGCEESLYVHHGSEMASVEEASGAWSGRC
jgi:hypothetical protein